jgi:hypothetical protein
LVAGLKRWSPEVAVDSETSTLTLHVSEAGVLPEIARWVVGTGAELYSLTPRALSLEDLFVRVVGDDVSCEN